MRATEQVHFRWAAKGIGGVVNILQGLLDDGVNPDLESANQLLYECRRLESVCVRVLRELGKVESAAALNVPETLAQTDGIKQETGQVNRDEINGKQDDVGGDTGQK